ncbi:MAG: hypothetical protein HKM93_07125 [Desulfobacteraceae bacterium]|nr:hypothetical protein [Desulfobacteraceae bacterium]
MPARIHKLFLAIAVVMALMSGPVLASQKVNIGIKTILASDKAEFVDPQLKGLIKELRTVFRFTSYRMLGQDNLTIEVGKTGTVRLPGGRVLEVTPIGIQGKRSELELSILKKKRRIFNTRIKLLNGGVLTVGGPRHDNGFLLFNITGRF